MWSLCHKLSRVHLFCQRKANREALKIEASRFSHTAATVSRVSFAHVGVHSVRQGEQKTEKLHTDLHTKGGGLRLLLFLDFVMQLLVRLEDIRHVPPGQAIFC